MQQIQSITLGRFGHVGLCQLRTNARQFAVVNNIAMNLYEIIKVHTVYCVLVQEIRISIGASVHNIVMCCSEKLCKNVRN